MCSILLKNVKNGRLSLENEIFWVSQTFPEKNWNVCLWTPLKKIKTWVGGFGLFFNFLPHQNNVIGTNKQEIWGWGSQVMVQKFFIGWSNGDPEVDFTLQFWIFLD